MSLVTTLEGILDGYAAAAPELIEHFEAVSPAELYADTLHLFPGAGRRVLDVGAGTGRDAAWLAARGCRVLAVEPVAALRDAGTRLHPSERIEWIDDSLPELQRVVRRAERYDFVLLSAVWQHLDDERRDVAMRTLACVLAPGGCVLLSVRHGPGAPTRPCFPSSAEDAIQRAHRQGLQVKLRRSAPSAQARNRDVGVTWTWLAFSQVD